MGRSDCRHPRAVHEFDGKPGTIAQARALLTDFLDARRPPVPVTVVQDSVTIVSELVTNAVRYAPGRCTLVLDSDSTALTITVADTAAAVPVARAPDLERGTGGMGWHLVHRLAKTVQVRLQPPGKTVSATVALT